MKKILLSIIVCSMLLALCACNTSKPQAKPTATPYSTSAYQSDSKHSWPKTKMGNIPDPGKTIYQVTIEATGVSVDYINFPEEELRDYITKVQDAGFIYTEPGSDALADVTDLQSGGFMYMAYNENGETARVIFTNTKYTVITYRPADAGTATGDGAVVVTSGTVISE